MTLHSEGREIGGTQLSPVHRTTEIPGDVPSWPSILRSAGHGLGTALQGHVSGGRPLATSEVGFRDYGLLGALGLCAACVGRSSVSSQRGRPPIITGFFRIFLFPFLPLSPFWQYDP